MTAPAVHHNHITRDIKPAGQCPACDLYWGPPAVCPECRDGKCGNCIGYALDPATDVVGSCECTHEK